MGEQLETEMRNKQINPGLASRRFGYHCAAHHSRSQASFTLMDTHTCDTRVDLVGLTTFYLHFCRAKLHQNVPTCLRCEDKPLFKGAIYPRVQFECMREQIHGENFRRCSAHWRRVSNSTSDEERSIPSSELIWKFQTSILLQRCANPLSTV